MEIQKFESHTYTIIIYHFIIHICYQLFFLCLMAYPTSWIINAKYIVIERQ